ncbi:MAG: YhzD family protein [Firmicutes bacterium]|uniref:YhzD-like protein n=1 Tax=Melghirimyces thermohalophilus TaxID=1236220 RepID=A0A1G6LAD8_9BACL|nr:YhzD family protein [Melghirimyces thermohalophilus]MDA8353862.1 YhzD family protein [Bacillota bacterium]SDC40362.1 YhzD-like protein [Melghirimyces thermohalophilus]
MYHLTVYDQDGSKLYDEPIEATDDSAAKEKGHAILRENDVQEHPFRIVHTSGRLVEFLSHKGKKAKA